MRIIHLLNENQGAVMSLLTLAYVVFTSLIVIYTRRQTTQALKFHKEESCPYVVVDFGEHEETRTFHVVLQNIGKRPALDVHVSAEPSIDRTFPGDTRPVSFIEHPVAFLAPGRLLTDSIGWTVEYLKKYGETQYQITVTYKDSSGESYTVKSPLSVSHYKYRTTSFIVGKKPLELVAEHLGKIAGALEGITRR